MENKDNPDNNQVTLLNAQPIYKPFHYQWAYDAWQLQQRLHWLAEEVSMIDDIKDWKNNLTEAERSLLTHIFRFFTQAEIEVNGCYMKKYLQVFQPNEICMMLIAFSNMETIHTDAYSYLLDSIGMPEVEYQAFRKYQEMKEKYEFMQQFNCDSKFDIALTLAAFGAFMEGLQLFASFVILLNFQRFGKMKGMSQIIAWSVRDETLHCMSIIKLFHTFVEENFNDIELEKLQTRITEICKETVNHENAFIDLAFELGNVEGISAEEVKQYIKYIADRRLEQLRMKKIYNIDNNPMPWMDYIMNGIEHVNFFENRATEYSKSATTGSWEDVFQKQDDKK